MIKSEALKSFAARLKLLEGEELCAITFIRDYVQFTLGENILNTYTWPILDEGGILYHEDTLGYRDRLCGQIGNKVSEVSYEEPVAMIDFGELCLRVILDGDDCYETASLRDSGGEYSAV
ncbi:MAG: hypothetical protein SH809_05450 [Rhodothermales bacterium]|nr:hypothetical protein [Rhodothermales bacterium]